MTKELNMSTRNDDTSYNNIHTPLSIESAQKLKAGEMVLLSGIIYTARDAAHKRLIALIDENKELPLQLQDQILYYCGPTPARPGKQIGSAGPTTSSRMDLYAPKLIEKCGLRGMIGKGNRSKPVIDAMRNNKAVYFAATGGAGALISQCIISSTVIAYEDLGPEAIYKLEVKNMPLLVAIDSEGTNWYEKGPAQWRENYL